VFEFVKKYGYVNAVRRIESQEGREVSYKREREREK
jgi:hypothetical protein